MNESALTEIHRRITAFRNRNLMRPAYIAVSADLFQRARKELEATNGTLWGKPVVLVLPEDMFVFEGVDIFPE